MKQTPMYECFCILWEIQIHFRVNPYMTQSTPFQIPPKVLHISPLQKHSCISIPRSQNNTHLPRGPLHPCSCLLAPHTSAHRAYPSSKLHPSPGSILGSSMHLAGGIEEFFSDTPQCTGLACGLPSLLSLPLCPPHLSSEGRK